jgi:hypothetical protein
VDAPEESGVGQIGLERGLRGRRLLRRDARLTPSVASENVKLESVDRFQAVKPGHGQGRAGLGLSVG